MGKLTVLDLFSGIGGISLGLERTDGFQTVAFCEINPFCREVLRRHWPDVPIHEDVRTLKGFPVDMVAGGSPCQGFSAAGKGRGLEDDRSRLWFEMLRLVRECRPRWVLVENVPAIKDRGADEVLSGLEGAGYSCWPLVVGAWAVGSPQKRDRVWIVALEDAARDGQRGQSQEERPDGERAGQAGHPRGEEDRWPARPGEPQLAWEAPRLAEPRVGGAAHGLPEGLAGLARRHSLQALGNSVVPQVAQAVGEAILLTENRARRTEHG